MSYSNNYYNCYFRLEFSKKTENYFVYPNYLVKDFINYIKKQLRDDFKINNDEDIEIISRQSDKNNIELAPDDITLRQFYKNVYKKRRFYVRVIQLSFKIDINENTEIEDDNIRFNCNDKIIGEDNV